MKILIVDENIAGYSRIVKAFQNPSKLEVKHCNNFLNFKKIIASEKFDVILAEYRIGSATAIDLLTYVRENGLNVPFIVVSAALEDTEIVEILQKGVTDYVSTKNMSRLNVAIERAIRECHNKTTLEKLIQDQNERYASKNSLINNVPGVVYRSTAKDNWKPEYLSEMCETVTTFSIEELYERGYAKIIHPEDLPLIEKIIDQAILDKKHFEIEYRIITKNKSIRHLWEKGIAIYDSLGNVEALEGLIIDVTKERNREKLLAEINDTINIQSGKRYFEKLTEFLCAHMQVKVAFVGLYLESENAVESISFRVNGQQLPAMKYTLANTPCANVIGKKACIYTSGVQALFPLDKDLVQLNAEGYVGIPVYNSENKPTGLIVLIDDKPFNDFDLDSSVLPIIASRVGNELDRLIVENNLLLSQKKYQQVVENQLELIVQWRADGKVMFANQSFLNYHKIELAELEKKSYFNLVTDKLRFEKKIAGLTPKSPISRDTHNYEKNGGGLIWEEWTDKGFFDLTGKLIEVHSIGRNISDQKNAELKIIESQTRLELAQKIGKIGSWEVDYLMDQRIWSREMYNIFNCDYDSFIPSRKSINECIYFEDRHIVSDWLDAAKSGVNIGQMEYRIPNKDGSFKYIIAYGDLIKDTSGKVIKVLGTAQDITSQKFAEFEIKRSEEFNLGILSALQSNIAVINKDGFIVATNETWKQFSRQNNGLISKTDIGMNYFEVCKKAIKLKDDSAKNALNGILEVLDKKSKTFELEYPCHSEFEERWFLMRVTAFAGNLEGVVVSHVDITEKKNSEKELEASYKEILCTERINNALINGDTVNNISAHILDGLQTTVGIEQSRIYLFSKAENKLTLVAEKSLRGIMDRIEQKKGIKINQIVPDLIQGSWFDKIIQNGKYVLTNNDIEIKQIISDHTSNLILKRLSNWAIKIIGIRTFGIYPLIDKNSVIGLLTVVAKHICNQHEKDTILRFSRQASTILAKKLEEDLVIANQEKFKAISNYTANWETWFDTQGKPIWINPGVIKLIGYTAEELIASDNFIKLIIYAEDVQIVTETLMNGLVNKTEGDNFEFRCNHKNGSHPWFSVSWKQVYADDGTWLGIRTSGIDITQKKLQKQELIKREQMLSETQTIAKLGRWEWDTITDRILLSQEMIQIFEISEPEKYRYISDLLELIHPDSKGRFNSIVRNALNNFVSKDIELKIYSKDVSEKYVLIRASNQSFDFANTKIIYGTALEITELKKSYELIHLSENKFKKIFETIQDVYYQTTHEGIITLISPSVHNLLGYTPEEMIGKPISKFYKNPRLNELKTARQHFLGKINDFEATLNSVDGTEVVVSIKINIIRNENERHFSVQGLMRNITEKKRQELYLENQRNRLIEIVKLNTQIIETSDQFFYVLEVEKSSDFNNPIKYISPQILPIMGITEFELLKKKDRWFGFIHPNDQTRVNDCVEDVFKLRQPVEASYRLKNQQTGMYIWVDDYICPLLNDEGNVIEIYGSVKDVTERKNAIIKIENEKKQTALSQLQLLSSQLNPHFIYNTLNAFQYYILKGSIEDSLNHISEFSNLMRKVLENSMHQSITIEDEINFLKQYVEISKRRMKIELQFKISTHPDIDVSEQLIPPMLLQPYVENSIIHGFSESKEGAILEVRFTKIDERIFCSVTDNGIGRQSAKELQIVKNQLGKQSFAVAINQKRINLLNQITDNNFKVEIIDLQNENGEPTGTNVIVNFLQILDDK